MLLHDIISAPLFRKMFPKKHLLANKLQSKGRVRILSVKKGQLGKMVSSGWRETPVTAGNPHVPSLDRAFLQDSCGSVR